MSNSPQPTKQNPSINQTHNRKCDFCEQSTALLYCRADSAKLCFSCDRQVHSTNHLFTKHTRNHLCDACHSSAASIFCSTENAVVCSNCDWERHSLSSENTTFHDRRPLEGFTGCPSVDEILGFIGFEDLSKKGLIGGGDGFGGCLGFGFGGGLDGYCDLFVWETPAVVSLDDLIVADDSRQNFQAMGVPPLPKNRKAACGQYKEEILNQLRAMAISEPNLNDGQEEDFESLMQFKTPASGRDLQLRDTRLKSNHSRESTAFWSSEASALQSGSDSLEFVENCLVPDNKPDYGGGPSHSPKGVGLSNAVEATKVLPKVVVRELTSEERDYAISRYKEKKKTRRFEKQVRYESRKIRAESRTRVKGRFAKVDK